MSQPLLDLKSYFVGHMAGEGRVLGLTGRVLRVFTLDFFGEWSIGHDALHLDETVVYADGRQVRRHWALQFDGQGGLSGYDSHQAARLRGRPGPGCARLVFDRPIGLTPEIAAPRVVLDLTEVSQGALDVKGRTDLMGLPLQRTQAVLRRD